MAAAAKLFGCFKRGQSVLGEIAEKSQGVMFGGSKKVRLSVVWEACERASCVCVAKRE